MSNFPNQAVVYLEGNPVKQVSLLNGNATRLNSPKSIAGSEREQIILCDPLTGVPLDLAAGGGAVSSVAGKTGAVTLATTDLTDVAVLSQQATDPQSGTTYTLVLADAGENVDMANASPNTLTIPANATAAFPVGTIVTVTMAGAGTTTIAAAGGVTIVKPAARTLAISAQYETALLYKTATNTWRVLCG